MLDETLEDFQDTRATPVSPTGVVVDGRYLLGEPLGSGGNSRVYEARHLETDAIVALKLSSHRGELVRARMRREARLASRFDEPGIVRVLDIGPHKQGYFLTMERLYGLDLEDRVHRRGVLSIREATSLVGEIAATCARMHAAGVIHRDLKPSNVFVCAEGPAKIIDFGTAKELEAVLSLTRSGIAVGTAAFIAPEQIVDSRCVGPAVDSYALGGILLYALTARLPHAGPSPMEMFQQAVAGDVPELAELRDDVSPELATLARRLLHVEPTRRPTADEAASALRSMSAPRTVLRQRPGWQSLLVVGA